jgi:hypothetical protein
MRRHYWQTHKDRHQKHHHHRVLKKHWIGGNVSDDGSKRCQNCKRGIAALRLRMFVGRHSARVKIESGFPNRSRTNFKGPTHGPSQDLWRTRKNVCVQKRAPLKDNVGLCAYVCARSSHTREQKTRNAHSLFAVCALPLAHWTDIELHQNGAYWAMVPVAAF